MNWSLVLNTVVVIAVVVLVGFIGLVSVQLFRTLGSLKKLSDEVEREIKPMAQKLQTTIDGVNQELSRVEGIVKSAEGLSKKVDATTKVAQEMISSPLIKVAALSAGIKKAVGALVKKD